MHTCTVRGDPAWRLQDDFRVRVSKPLDSPRGSALGRFRVYSITEYRAAPRARTIPAIERERERESGGTRSAFSSKDFSRPSTTVRHACASPARRAPGKSPNDGAGNRMS